MSEPFYFVGLGCVCLGAVLGWAGGWVAGYQRGRAFGWQEGVFRRNDDDAAARDCLGRFLAKRTKRKGRGPVINQSKSNHTK